jgi:hypothetical protein
MSKASSDLISDEVDDSLKRRMKRKARDSDSDTDSGSDDSSSSSGGRSSGSNSSHGNFERVRKSSRKEKKKSKKSSKKKKKKSERKKKKKKKHKKEKKRYSEAELHNQRAIDELDQEAKDFAASIGGSSKLSEREQASLLYSDFQSRAMSLGLPKGLIRTTGVGGSGLFSAGGRFGDKATHQQLAGGFGEDENPAAAARRKREQRAQQAEARAREILLERAASADHGDKKTESTFASLTSRFGASNIQKRFM